jgi:carbonic anhydrase/acetyltransferase-like protein (isoleucine patch superfamily)
MKEGKSILKPMIASTAKIFPQAIVTGDVTIGEFVNVWYSATLRGDMAKIMVGENTNIQDNAVVHTNTNLPTLIGKNVTIGHGAIIHACTIEDDVLIGMGAIILDGAIVRQQAMVGAGCVVPPGKEVPRRTLVVGNPMRIVRELSDQELAINRDNVRYYLELSQQSE